MKRYCAIIVAYNEESMIEGCLEGLKDIQSIVIISKPWMGKHINFDRTEKIALDSGAMIVKKDFNNEKDQRNYGMELARQLEYDYAFIIDADEYYSTESIKNAIDFIEKNPETERFNIGICYYFWKNTDWEIIPRFFNVIPACYKTTLSFNYHRNISTEKTLIFPKNVVCYHFSYAGKDDRILNKLEHFSHANEMDPDWFKNVWKKWTPEMRNLNPRKGGEKSYEKAIPFICPEDIKNRFNKGFLLK